MDLQRIIACVLHVVAVALASSAPPRTAKAGPSPTASPSASAGGDERLDLDAFLKRRCGTEDGRPALWSYEGRLTDPSSGRVVAEVEGLELIRQIPSPSADGLISKRILDGSSSWDSARSVLCRRVFCYKRPSSGKNRSISSKDGTAVGDSASPVEGGSLLTSIRLRPDGPLRHLDPSECVAAYDTAITYVSRNKGRELFVISERGGKASCAGAEEEEDLSKYYTMGAAKVSSSNDSSLFGYSILAQGGVAQIDGGNIQLPPTELLSHSSDDEVVVSPPRSRLLQFGKGDGTSSSDRKYGSIRETYNFRFDEETSEAGPGARGLLARLRRSIDRSDRASAVPKESTVQYSRYGESPPWYAPGRSCTLSLQGMRLDDRPKRDNESSSQQLPPTVSWLADRCGFWSGWPAQFAVRRSAGGSNCYQPPEDHNGSLGQQAVKMLKYDDGLTTRRLKDEQPFENSYKKSAIENAFSYVGARARTISSSFVLCGIPDS